MRPVLFLETNYWKSNAQNLYTSGYIQISLCSNLPQAERFVRSRLLILYSHVRQRAAAALAAGAAVA